MNPTRLLILKVLNTLQPSLRPSAPRITISLLTFWLIIGCLPWHTAAAKEPTPEEQYFVELLNRARANPDAEAARLNIALNEGSPNPQISATSKPPLAFNTKVMEAASNHLSWMNSGQGAFSHTASGNIGQYSFTGVQPSDRLAYTNQTYVTWRENLAITGRPQGKAAIDQMHELLFKDTTVPGRLHRVSILLDQLTDIGLTIGDVSKLKLPGISTGAVQLFIQDSASSAKLTGVAIDDKDGNQFYTIGEGLGDVDVEIVGTNVKGNTWASGGYNLDISSLANGQHQVRFTRADKIFVTSFTRSGDRNVKVDAIAKAFVDPPVVVPPVVPPTISAFTASASSITTGEKITLHWTTTGATSLSINGTEVRKASGSIEMSPTKTTKYTFTATNESDSVTKDLSVTVTDPPVVKRPVVNPPTSTLATGLVAYYPLDGDLQDNAGSSHGEGKGAAPIAYGAGAFGNGIVLNGVDQFVQTPIENEDIFDFGAPDTPSSFAISLWFRVDDFNKGWQSLISKGEDNRWRIHRRAETNTITGNGGNGDVPEGTTNINDGNIHHIVLVSDAEKDSARLYIDGTLEAENSGLAREGNDMPMMIGENPDKLGRTWNGLIDDVAFWNRSLTNDEIATLSTGGDSLGQILTSGAPVLPSIERVVGGSNKVGLAFKGAAGKSYKIEFSSDLRTWTTIDSGLSGDFNYEDTHASRVGKTTGYYRVVEN